jgi:PncC family amidohydrolase
MDTCEILSIAIGSLLRSKNLWLVTAESCTGGQVGQWVTRISGSSEYYLGGFITYSNFAKMLFLNVRQSTLDQFGAVSRETVVEMADGARKAFAEVIPEERIVSISVSGIAGPGGGTSEKPVGTVWFGLAGAQGNRQECELFAGSREEIQNLAAQRALDLVKAYIEESI